MNPKSGKTLTALLLLIAGTGLFAAEEVFVPESKAINWYHFAELSTMPNLQNGKKLNDGDLTTGAEWTGGSEAPADLTFRFPQKIFVEAFRFVQNGSGTTRYRILGDTVGNGKFDTVLAEREDPKMIAGKPITLKIGKKVHALKFVTLEGNSGYRAPFPGLQEIEIFSPDKIEVPVKKSHDIPEFATGKEIPLPSLNKRNIDIRICTDLWSYGLPLSNYSDPKNPKPAKPMTDEQKKKNIQNTIKFMKDVDANSVRLFVESVAGSNTIPWKSDLTPGYCDDLLKFLTDELHANNLKAYYFSHAWMSPFQKRGEQAPNPYLRWDYPYEQSDRLITTLPDFYKVKYPCVLSDSDFRDKWTQYLIESLDNGADGVYLMPDEWYFKGHDLRHADCKSCNAEFKKMYGYDSIPQKIENTEQYRKWKLFEYQKIRDLFDYTAAEIRKKHPKAKIVRSDCGIGNASRGRLEHTTASDIIWENRDLADYTQMYACGGKNEIAFVKDHEAVAGRDKLSGSMQWLGISYGTRPDFGVRLYGQALADIMLGARAIDHYRMSYIQKDAWIDNLKECNKMIRLLEAWNIDKTEEPASVCLLLSRASEDWWSVRERSLISKENQSVAFYLHLAGDDVNKRKRMTAENEQDKFHQQNDTRGQGAKAALNGVLLDNGIPYKILYTDRPDTLKDLSKFKLLVIPFSYAMSEKAFAEIKKAAQQGSKIVIFDQLAPVNEFGSKHDKPLLEELLTLKNVQYIPESPNGNGSNYAKRNEYEKLIADAVKEEGYSFDSHDADVSYLIAKYKDNSGWILFLANWEDKKTADITISLPGEKGCQYSAVVYSPVREELNEITVNGSPALSFAELKDFGVKLLPGEVKLIRITK